MEGLVGHPLIELKVSRQVVGVIGCQRYVLAELLPEGGLVGNIFQQPQRIEERAIRSLVWEHGHEQAAGYHSTWKIQRFNKVYIFIYIDALYHCKNSYQGCFHLCSILHRQTNAWEYVSRLQPSFDCLCIGPRRDLHLYGHTRRENGISEGDCCKD